MVAEAQADRVRKWHGGASMSCCGGLCGDQWIRLSTARLINAHGWRIELRIIHDAQAQPAGL